MHFIRRTGLRIPFSSIDVIDPVALLPPELPGSVALSDVPINAPCHLAVAVRRLGMQSVSVEIPLDCWRQRRQVQVEQSGGDRSKAAGL